MKLLTAAAANAKTAKNASQGAYLSFILHLAPSDLSGFNVCPKASAGCKAACLNTAGRGAFNTVQAARIKKTWFLVRNRSAFMTALFKDLTAVQKKADRLGLKAVVRLNGMSDLDWTRLKGPNGLNAFETFPRIQFYDYTKVIKRIDALRRAPIANYHVTFSQSEDNRHDAIYALFMGFNVATVFLDILPRWHLSRPVLDGDTHDLRFLDRSISDGLGAVIGLKAKGRAKKDLTGFVQRTGGAP